MGELQHGTYNDECEGLTQEEINAFYGFGKDGEPIYMEESNQLDDLEEQEDKSYEEIKEHFVPNIEVCFSYNYSS